MGDMSIYANSDPGYQSTKPELVGKSPWRICNLTKGPGLGDDFQRSGPPVTPVVSDLKGGNHLRRATPELAGDSEALVLSRYQVMLAGTKHQGLSRTRAPFLFASAFATAYAYAYASRFVAS